MSNVVKVLFTLVVIVGSMFALFYDEKKEDDKSKYYDDITLIDYEADSFSYRASSSNQETVNYRNLNGNITTYVNQDQEVNVTIDMEIFSGLIKVVIISNDGTIIELMDFSDTIKLEPYDKIKVVGDNGSVEMSIMIIEE